ncbi:MAG: YfhO family protein, partial [Chloroflexi bacterium]|nr:YfhO family protein [Chloroflexota bacterium]
LGVGYLIVDRKNDLDVDGVFFDREIDLSIEPGGAVTVPFANEIRVSEVAVVGEVTAGEGGDAIETSGWIETLRGETVLASMPVLHGASLSGGKFAIEIGDSIVTDLTASSYVSKRKIDSPGLADGIRIRSAPGMQLTVRAITVTNDQGQAIPLPLRMTDPLEILHWTDAKVYKNPNPLPRVFLVNSFAVTDGSEAAAAALRSDGFDPREVVLLEKSDTSVSPSRPLLGWFGDQLRDAGLRGPRARAGALGQDNLANLVGKAAGARAESPEIPTFDLGAGNARGEARVVSYEAGRIGVAVDTTENAILVVGDAIYPGWKVRIDGEEAPVMRANMLFKAVPVPAGSHEVAFSYESNAFLLGTRISIASLVALLAAAVALVLWDRRKARQA